MNSKASLADEVLARQICERREIAGTPVELGTFVAIANGRVVGVGASFKHADALLNAAGIDVGDGMVCEVAALEVETIR